MFDGLSHGGALLAGILSFLSPCILPIVPGYIGYLAGLGGGGDAATAATTDPTTAPTRFRRVISAVFFVAGFLSVFMMLGLAASLIAPYLKLFQQIAGGLIILLGAHFLGLFRIGFLDFEAKFNPGARFRKIGVLGAFPVGLAFGFGWTPCVGPVLATIFLVISTSTDGSSSGVGLLLAYGLGIGIPFIVVAAFTDLFIKHFASMRRAVPAAKIALGLIMVATGILMVTGQLNAIGFWMLRNLDIFGTVG